MLLLRVDTEIERLRAWVRGKAQVGSIWNYDRTQGEIMGGYGGDDKTATIGGENGTATAERIGGGTGGGGHYETVAGIGGDKVIVDKEVGAQQRSVVKPMEADLIERCEWRDGRRSYLKKCAGFKSIAAGKDIRDEGVNIVAAGGSEEAEMPKVDAQHGYVAIADEMDGTEQGAVATNREKKVVVNADRQTVGHLFSVDTIAVQHIGEQLELLAQGRFEVADVKGDFHFKLKIHYYYRSSVTVPV